MFRTSTTWIPRQLILATALCLAGTSAFAQQTDVTQAGCDGRFPFRQRWNANQPPCLPGVPSAPAPGTVPPSVPPSPPDVAAPPTTDMADAGGRGAALASASLALPNPGGYLENAVIKNMFRVRYDYAFNFNRPDRAEFFFAAWREINFHPHGVLNETQAFQANRGRGLDANVTRLDMQETSAYLELGRANRFSVFAEVPWRMLDTREFFIDDDRFGSFGEPREPDPHEAFEEHGMRNGGFGDAILGLKYAIIGEPDCALTLQVRAFFPTGDTRFGLGTGHYSIEPGLLFYQRVTDRLHYQSEFKGWIPLGGTTNIIDGRNWAGSVLTYGAGLGFDVIQRPNLRVTPLIELVGWTVLDGLETVNSPDHSPLTFGAPNVPQDHGTERAGITSILNLKVGVRTYLSANDDFYVGYGHSITPERWYNEIARAEYRRTW